MRYTEEQRLVAVDRVEGLGERPIDVARDIGCSPLTLRRWRKAAKVTEVTSADVTSASPRGHSGVTSMPPPEVKTTLWPPPSFEPLGEPLEPADDESAEPETVDPFEAARESLASEGGGEEGSHSAPLPPPPDANAIVGMLEMGQGFIVRTAGAQAGLEPADVEELAALTDSERAMLSMFAPYIAAEWPVIWQNHSRYACYGGLFLWGLGVAGRLKRVRARAEVDDAVRGDELGADDEIPENDDAPAHGWPLKR